MSDNLIVKISVFKIDLFRAKVDSVIYFTKITEGDKMNYLHYEFNAGPDDVIEVTLDKAANVQLVDSTNYSHYRSGEKYKYFGGHAKVSPFHLTPPHCGHWHVVIDLGGYAGSVRASARLVKG